MRSKVGEEGLKLYKELVELLGEYRETFTRLKVNELLELLIDRGIKAIPKDIRARKILSSIIGSRNSVPVKIEELLEGKFTEVVISLRPIYLKEGNRRVARWFKGSKACYKVLDLINVDNVSPEYWCDKQDNKIELIDKKEVEHV